MLKKVINFIVLILLSVSISAQTKTAVKKTNASEKKNIPSTSNSIDISTHPKLVIGLVIDQMRWDYLYKFENHYSNKGFKRLLNQGFSCENTLITHLPTYTAVGHTGIYTGSLPSIHGIVGNNWYDKNSGKSVYCTDDSTVSGVGSNNEEGKMSPRNMFVSTIADELRLSNNFSSKSIGISLKDRGAILPAGHNANAAYWFDDKLGKWISSTYYMNDLPEWVNQFNAKQQPDSFMSTNWETILPINQYTKSTKDAVDYEGTIPGEKTNVFPHQLGTIAEKKYSAFKYTPFGNTYTLNFAKSTIENERLGKGDVTDFLAVSLSSTDYIGHVFGPNSIEIEDTYIRLDKDIADLLDYLDAAYGKNNYLFFLSADHGVAHNPSFLNVNKMPGGNYSNKDLIKELNDSIQLKFGVANAVVKMENAQLYLQKELSNGWDGNSFLISKTIVDILTTKSFVSQVYDIKLLSMSLLPEVIKTRAMNSYFSSRSGDIQIVPKPGFFDGGKTGTTHGVWNPYDAHIPLLFMGWNINPGKTHREVHMTDIAPTISALLNIQMPNGCVGNVIGEIIK